MDWRGASKPEGWGRQRVSHVAGQGAPPNSPHPGRELVCSERAEGNKGPNRHPRPFLPKPGALLALCFREDLEKFLALSKQPVATWLPTVALLIHQEKCSF